MTCIIVKSVENYENGISADFFVCILIDVVQYRGIFEIFREIFQGKKITKLYITTRTGRLTKKTPLSKPNRGEGTVSTKPRLKSVYDFLGSVYCFHCLMMCLSAQRDILDDTPGTI